MIVAFSGLAGAGKDTSADYLVAKYGFVKVAFADEMKRICFRLFPKSTREHWWGPSSKRNEPIEAYPTQTKTWDNCLKCNTRLVPNHVGGSEDSWWECPTHGMVHFYLTARYALQKLGSEWGRDCYENVWVDFVMNVYHCLVWRSGIARSVHYSYTSYDGLIVTSTPNGPKVKGVVVSDLRWPEGNEGQAVLEQKGALIKLKRGAGLKGAAGQHRSEMVQQSTPDEFFTHLIDNREWELDQLYAHLDYLATTHLLRGKKK